MMVSKKDLKELGYSICINKDYDMVLYLAQTTVISISCKRVNIQGSKFSSNDILIDDCKTILNGKEKKITIFKDTKTYSAILANIANSFI